LVLVELAQSRQCLVAIGQARTPPAVTSRRTSPAGPCRRFGTAGRPQVSVVDHAPVSVGRGSEAGERRRRAEALGVTQREGRPGGVCDRSVRGSTPASRATGSNRATLDRLRAEQSPWPDIELTPMPPDTPNGHNARTNINARRQAQMHREQELVRTSSATEGEGADLAEAGRRECCGHPTHRSRNRASRYSASSRSRVSSWFV
jgi:hypothetical protein